MYGISKDLAVNENNYFDGGIHDGVIIEKISYENVKKDDSGKMILAFHFKGAKGETFRHVEWPIEESDAKAESKVANMGKRVKHILSKFMPEENIVINNVTTFEQYANAIVTLAGSSFNGKTFSIKLLYDDKNNLGFPKYVGFIAKDAGTLKISNTEKIVKEQPTSTGAVENFAVVVDQF